ncbi:hypothetical protein HPB50_023016 [Hyalomma asiaticum]|uniref:Uncharacterized protein n=1 Tax=Hyalomma asiaticum TaxID=266040 RepID=A0ACB7S938_HYAAI|nr:hypothetical protein HPB50_023016 [Hyalomma asiaticum]
MPAQKTGAWQLARSSLPSRCSRPSLAERARGPRGVRSATRTNARTHTRGEARARPQPDVVGRIPDVRGRNGRQHALAVTSDPAHATSELGAREGREDTAPRRGRPPIKPASRRVAARARHVIAAGAGPLPAARLHSERALLVACTTRTA